MRTVTNLIASPSDFSTWGKFVSGDGAADVVNGQLVCSVTNGRAFRTKQFSLQAGSIYKLTVNIERVSGDVSYPAIFTTGTTQGIPATPSIAGRYSLAGRITQVVNCTATGLSTLWLGVGTTGTQVTPGSMTVSGIQLEDVTSNLRHNASEFVSGAQQFDYALSNFGVAIGDSIALTGYYADQLMQTITTCDITKKGVGGQTLPQIQARFSSDVVALQPRFVLIEGGINDIQLATTDPTPAMQGAVTAMVNASLSAGIVPIVLNVGPFKGSANWTDQRQAWHDAYNAWLAEYALMNGVAMLDIYALLDVSQALPPEYDSGDHLHPSTLAHRVIGNALRPLVGVGNTVPL